MIKIVLWLCLACNPCQLRVSGVSDPCFVSQLGDDKTSVITSDIINEKFTARINLGQGFNIQVVAEGVETQSQLNVLQNLHCVIMQGYRFSQPLLAEDASKFLLQHHTVKM